MAFATAWGPKFGGINAFNMDLLQAIAAAHWQRLRVICVVAACDEADVQTALTQDQVTLINLGLSTGAMGHEHVPLVKSKLDALDFSDTVWLGHDRITGAIANAMAAEYGGRSALIHHMSYDHYESFAESSRTAAEKQRLQKSLFEVATVRMAVGPLLRDALADMLDVPSSEIPMLVPGLAEIEVKKHHRKFVAFISGRLDAGARKIKQAQLGLAGFAHAVHQCDRTAGLPDSLKGAGEPKILLRGIDMEVPADPGFADAEQELRAFAEAHAHRAINLQALPYCHNRQELFNELRTASVCLMPSWHEGFGLVAWEAIAAGVPLILSQKSGVYQLLKQKHLEQWVQPLDIKGSHLPPYFTEDDKQATADALIQVAQHPEKFHEKAHLLRAQLLNEYTWRNGADAFAQELGWQAPNIAPSAAAPISPDGPTLATPTAHPFSQWLEQPRPQWSAHAGLHPSQLLRAEEALVPFAPESEPFLDEQMTWATVIDYPIGVRLLTGEGGTGKTRLALELCERLRQQGWNSGFLRHNLQPREAATVANELGRAERPVLIVLDYAETRSLQLLELLAQALTLPSKHKVRLLLLARSSGDWWGQLPGIDARCESLLDGAATTGPYPVPTLYDTPSQRQVAFAQALRAFASVLHCAAPDIQPDLHATAYGKPLYLHMAALLALLGERQASAGALPLALVRHEQRYWHKATGTPSNESSCALLMSLVTLSGPAARPRDLEPLWRSVEGEAAQLKPLFNALAPLYPETQGLGGLRPDLLGEALVAQQLLGTHGAAILAAVLGKVVTEAQRLHALTVLSRLLRYRSDLTQLVEDALAAHFAACAKGMVKVTVQTPSPLPQVAEASFKHLSNAQKLQVAGLLESDFKDDVLPLGGLELLIRQTLSDQAQKRCESAKRPSVDDWERWGGALLNLGTAHNQVGDNNNALAYTRMSVEKLEPLAHSQLERVGPTWAMALSNYANFLAEDGQHAEALKRGKQALDIRERLAKAKPELFEPDWAMSLNNYANRLADDGQHTEALKRGKQALDIRERLAKAKPELFEPDWATSLSNYASHLADDGQHTEAFKHAKLALDIHERLAQAKPERFEPDWAASLNNYANLLADDGQHTEALKHAKLALDSRERLAQAKPERFAPDWAMSLNNYASLLADDGQHTEALNHAKLALDIHERLAQAKPERFEPDWATSLNNYANLLADDGQHTEALNHAKLALDIHERLAQAKPERFEPEWAMSLHNYANRLADEGQLTEALKHAKLALDIHKRLAQTKPERFEPEWAMSLHNYANRLADEGQLTEALKHAKLALDIHKRLAQTKPERFEPVWATSLNSLANVLADIGQLSEAFKHANLALDIWERLAIERSARYQVDADNAQLLTALLAWLAGNGNLVLAANWEPEVDDPHSQRPNRFFRAALLSLAAQDGIAALSALDDAWLAWGSMSGAQHVHWEQIYLLACAWANHHGSLPPDMAQYQQQLERLRMRRRGHLPAWMVRAAELKGFVLE
ncbi:tetratricopeptide repeat protein [Hydrogenophaga sp. RWCD_12]|uniref:tetratricopeptide repeat protein n=1 Tax=Hydrogenophaga sp. RWCD_12 TaxID=3391190 RepID=UPI003984B3D1